MTARQDDKYILCYVLLSYVFVNEHSALNYISLSLHEIVISICFVEEEVENSFCVFFFLFQHIWTGDECMYFMYISNSLCASKVEFDTSCIHLIYVEIQCQHNISILFSLSNE